jgi:hypothetical protein
VLASGIDNRVSRARPQTSAVSGGWEGVLLEEGDAEARRWRQTASQAQSFTGFIIHRTWRRIERMLCSGRRQSPRLVKLTEKRCSVLSIGLRLGFGGLEGRPTVAINPAQPSASAYRNKAQAAEGRSWLKSRAARHRVASNFTPCLGLLHITSSIPPFTRRPSHKAAIPFKCQSSALFPIRPPVSAPPQTLPLARIGHPFVSLH